MTKQEIKRVNSQTYVNENHTLFKPACGMWTLYYKGEEIDKDIFRSDVAERNGLILIED